MPNDELPGVVTLELNDYRKAISEAKKAVQNDEEPYRSIAFKAILERLLDSPDNGYVESKQKRETRKKTVDRMRTHKTDVAIEDEQVEITFNVPKEHLPEIMKLDDREKIPVFWYYSSKKSMTISEFLMAASKKGFNFAPSYLPSEGGNFTNRLVKLDGVLAKDGKKGRSFKFKLTDVGVLKVEKIIAGFSNPKSKS